MSKERFNIRISRKDKKEIAAEAARQNRSLSWLLQKAWLLAKDKILNTPSNCPKCGKIEHDDGGCNE